MWPSSSLAALVALGTLVSFPVALPADQASPSASATPQVQDLHPQVEELIATVDDLSGIAKVQTSSARITVTLNSNVLFGKDSAVIQARARARLAEVGAQLRAAAPGSVEITGYTDDLGSAEHGLVLSRQRAAAVQKQLATSLAGKEVTVIGKGEADPAVPNKDEASRAQNRRVVIRYTKS